jgi:hypothetical protein
VNSTAEAWAAALCFVQLPLSIYVLVLVARYRLTGTVPAAPAATPVPARPAARPRNHEPGECWCGDEHADALADDEPAWRVS